MNPYKMPRRPLRAGGNLNFSEFISLIDKIWKETTGGKIPFLASGTEREADYPCILYSVANKVNKVNESRPRQREVMRGYGDALRSQTPIVYGQKQVYHIKFTAVDRVSTNGSHTTEDIITLFEDFMLEYTPVMMWKGVGDIRFERRLADNDEVRKTEDILTKAIVYRVEIERHTVIDMKNLMKVLISAGIDPEGLPIETVVE